MIIFLKILKESVERAVRYQLHFLSESGPVKAAWSVIWGFLPGASA
jgi:hypothetical protein